MSESSLSQRFDVISELHADGAEVLLRARDSVLHREVILKCPGPGLAKAFRDKDLRRRVLQEARALAKVEHPGIAGLLDVLESKRGPVLVMPPLSGETLGERCQREGPLEPEEVILLGRRICEALEAVHGAGVVHRGLSASSIVLGARDRPFLTGFHFAKHSEGTVSQTSILYRGDPTDASTDSSITPALPSHPAPEQTLGRPADARSDLFGLGWVLYEAACGEPPYDSIFPSSWGAQTDSIARRSDLGKPLARILSRCLQADPIKRPQSATELREALMAAAEGGRGAGGRVTPLGKPWIALAVAALALLVLRLGGVWPVAAEVGNSEYEDRGIPLGEGRAEAYAPSYAQSHALVIGIGEPYARAGFPSLPNAEGDASTLGRTLGELTGEGWQVQTLLGDAASRDGILDAMDELAKRSAEDDRVLIYYAGHGIPHENTADAGWILPSDAEVGRRTTWVRFDEFFHFFSDTRAKHVLLAMDCCYGGRLVTTRSVSPRQNLGERYLTRRAHVVLSSGRPDEVVSDGASGEHSPFLTVFLEQLRGSEPFTSSMLFARMQASFVSQGIEHSPQYGYPDGAETGGEVVFFPSD